MERIASSLTGIKFILNNFVTVIFVSLLDLATFSPKCKKLLYNSLCKPCFRNQHENFWQS